MRIIGRRRSRRQRVARQIKELRKAVPASVSLPDMPELPELPKRPALPSMPEVSLPKRPSRDTGGDTPFLSLTGGLLLGLVVGMIVAAILLNRREDGASASQRPTGIKLLSNQGGEAPQSHSAVSNG